jgi:toxin ParE1/3/4
MTAFSLTRKAKADLSSIGRYAQRKWGKEQRNQYLTQLDQAFYTLAKNLLIGRSCDHIREGYGTYSIGKHIIFYRQYDSDTISIVRILHQRIDVERHL